MALPGDELTVKDGQIYRKGEVIAEAPEYMENQTIKISKDDTLTLMLADESGKEVEASWSINAQPYASLSGSRVKGLLAGTATVTATYNGKTYTCKIRIVK